MIYVFGDPVASVLSFFQRRERRHGRHGFDRGGQEQTVPMAGFARKAMANAEALPGPLGEEDGLERYLAQDRDLFRIEEHVNNHLYADRAYPILFLRYETLWKQADVLRDLFPQMPSLPAHIPRSAELETQPGGLAKGLEDLYAEPRARLAALPDIFVMQEGCMTGFA